MSLSNELISQFVKATRDTQKTPSESTVYGTVMYDGRPYVLIDGSATPTPVTTTADIRDGERVTVMIKNHTATVTGNTSSPSARKDDVKEMGSKITVVENLVADTVSTEMLEAETARINILIADTATINGKLSAAEADIKTITTDNITIKESLTAAEANIEDLETEKLSAETARITYATIDNLNATNATVENLDADKLSAYDASITYASIDSLDAVKASVLDLDAKKLSAESAEITYANIDFTNIGTAAMEHFYASSGLISNVVVGDQTITGELVGVTITGDLIQGNTIKAEKLVVKGADGLYYKLNMEGGTFTGGEVVPDDSLHGSVITAQSITANKVAVDDLVAFDATIGGFKITENSIYSGVKESASNTTKGIYMDSSGQMAIGDSNNYLKYFKDSDGKYKLVVSANSIRLSASNRTVEEAVSDFYSLAVGSTNLLRNSSNLIFSNYYFSGTFIAAYADGDIAITCGASATGDENNNVVMRTSATCSDDGSGNVTLA